MLYPKQGVQEVQEVMRQLRKEVPRAGMVGMAGIPSYSNVGLGVGKRIKRSLFAAPSTDVIVELCCI